MSTAPQLELFRPPVTDPNVIWLADYLFEYGNSKESVESLGWQIAKEILTAIPQHLREGEAKIDDRTIRAWAEAAAPKVISGQHGYKHTDHATAEEIRRFINTMESQGGKMIERAQKIRKYAHAKIG